MSNRQTLRDLQTRLAARLQAARTEGASVSWLAAEAGGRSYLFPLSQAGEIFPWTPVQPVPYTQPWFLGVANLRGGLCGVVDFIRFDAGQGGAGTPPDGPEADAGTLSASGQRADALTGEASLLSFNAGLDVQCALVVDKLAGLRGGEAFVSVRPPAEGGPAWLGHVYVDSQGGAWQEVDLQVLAQHPFFLSISS
ncbi:chemotaxis protein CheW [Xylophilus ampelinus]|uniref:Twitching motility protein PilI n=1 Tax=Xylophilus ampelinus TaxID=54067 RepID=A0A318SE21_9BURK|nr:chemotaxis protein CheW [Xylophilus ampelinus]MCS4511523.1 chemotaxis protein CheW [Xylophilus ampelinus]PYE74354.1 twitching motility protein PilI [Xylophilus ampelinus]